ncbi:MAG: hypothetical protein ACTSW4_08030 [Candidatus Ranarchaeia archaeon]
MRMTPAYLIRHLLASYAYRLRKITENVSPNFWDFAVGSEVRTPSQIINHMISLLIFACSFFDKSFHEKRVLMDKKKMLADVNALLLCLDNYLTEDSSLYKGLAYEKLIQGPIVDLITHVGQLAMIRKISGNPIKKEKFVDADIQAGSFL